MKKRSFSQTLNLLCNAQTKFMKPKGGLNVTRLATAIKLNQPTLARMLKEGSKTPEEDNAKKLCAFFKITREQLLGEAPIPSIDGSGNESLPESPVPIMAKKVKLRATIDGFEIQFFDDEDDSPLYFRKDWIADHGYREKSLVVYSVKGSSMEPALFEGDRVLINRDSKAPKNGRAFFVIVEGVPCIKRLRKRGSEWWITSDNQAHSNTDLPLENMQQIVGEAVAKSSIVI